MMEADLANELREATNQLLDLGPLQPATLPSPRFTPSRHLQKTRQPSKESIVIPKPTLATFSSSSKLEVLHSPTDVRPWQWPAPHSNQDGQASNTDPRSIPGNGTASSIKLEIGKSLGDDVDDNLPERGLSSRVESVKAATSKILIEHQDDSNLAESATKHDVELRASSSSKLRARTPVYDIYINQYGERVVNGKVVGRTLGGRPRPASRNGDTSQTTTDSALSRIATPLLTESPAFQNSVQTESMHAMSSTDTTNTPSFFLESFPDAFSPKPWPAPATSPPSSSSKQKKERCPSKGGPPFILKAPRAVAGALTLAHSDDVDDPPILHDTSFTTASDFGSPSSSSSRQFSPRIKTVRSVSTSSRRTADTELDTGVKGLALHNVDTGHLSPSEATATLDSTRPKLELPLLRRPTPTIGLSQANVDLVVLHGNRRQARASGITQNNSDDGSKASSNYTSPAISPPSVNQTLPSPPASFFSAQTAAQSAQDSLSNHGDHDSLKPPDYARHGSASEPSSPLMSPSRTPRQHSEAESPTRALTSQDDEEQDDDNASLESAPSSLISLPVSTLTNSSRTPSNTSLERRRSTSSAHTHHRRRSSANHSLFSSLFAREVYIRNWSIIGSQARGWVVYELRILTKQGTVITAHKRFSSFIKLRQTLKEECRDQAKWLPELPSKSTGLLSKYDAKYLEKRRRALQRWLEVVCLDKVWGASEALREWVLASD